MVSFSESLAEYKVKNNQLLIKYWHKYDNMKKEIKNSNNIKIVFFVLNVS